MAITIYYHHASSSICVCVQKPNCFDIIYFGLFVIFLYLYTKKMKIIERIVRD